MYVFCMFFVCFLYVFCMLFVCFSAKEEKKFIKITAFKVT